MAQARRHLIRASAAGAAGAALAAACGPAGGGPQEGGVTPAGSGKAVTVRFFAAANNVAGNADWEEYQEGKKLFESKYPKITLELTPNQSVEKFLAAAAAGDGFDVQDTCCDNIALEARANALLKLDPWVKKTYKDADVKDWIEWQAKFFNVDGAQYGIGRYMGTTALYFNRDRFRERGVALPDETWDWNRYREAMVKLADPTNRRWGGNLILGLDRRQAKVHQNGGYMVDPKDDMKSALDHPKTIEAFEWIRDRLWKDNGAPQPDQRPESAPGTPMGAIDLFAQGHTATWEDGSWSLVPLVRKEPSFDWDVVTLPRGPAQRDVLATTDARVVWAGTKNPEDTWLVMTFLNGDDWYAIQSKRLQPARLSWMPKWINLLTEANPKLKGKNLKAFVTPAEQGYARPIETYRYHAAVLKIVNDAYDDSVNKNQKPIRDTMVETARQVNEIQAKEHAAAGGKK